MVQQINEQEAEAYFERLDPLVASGTVMFVIGGSAIAQLGAKIRVTAEPKPLSEDSCIVLFQGVNLTVKTSSPAGPSARALYRLAIYQAAACDYGRRTFIASLRRRLNRPPITETEVPFGMVRDVVLTHYAMPCF